MLTEMPTAPIAGVREPAAKRKGGSPEDARQGKMMMNQKAKVTSEVKVVTPDYARHLRDTAHFERQRNINAGNIERLAKEMASGQFTDGTQIYLGVLPGGQELILNGNHTLEAIHASGVPQVLTITRKEVQDKDEAGRIYAVFDIQKVRTWRDSLRATGTGDEIPLANSVLSAVGVIENSFGHGYPKAPSRLDRISRIEEYREPAIMFAAAVQGAPLNGAKYVKRAAVMAIALETFRYQPSRASEFWSEIAHDEGLTTGNPAKALLSWLRNSIASGGQSAQREHCRASALAWNAAFKGRDLSVVKPNQMGAFFLLGTPWASGLER